MKIVTNFDNNILPNKYSKYADEADKYNGQPIVSFPFSIENIPSDCKYYCFTLIDHDAIPVCGFSWIHWAVANVDTSFNEILENFSQNDIYNKVQGTNSFDSLIANVKDPKIIHRYIGPTPPDKNHNYTLTIYALSDRVDVNEGFYLNELFKKMEGLIVSQASIDVIGIK
ncbi:YbhB/YbcL family Raf kinase inhibitor-like protein [Orbaceae bacterium ac157xtp]